MLYKKRAVVFNSSWRQRQNLSVRGIHIEIHWGPNWGVSFSTSAKDWRDMNCLRDLNESFPGCAEKPFRRSIPATCPSLSKTRRYAETFRTAIDVKIDALSTRGILVCVSSSIFGDRYHSARCRLTFRYSVTAKLCIGAFLEDSR
jgi:hypothetical protein